MRFSYLVAVVLLLVAVAVAQTISQVSPITGKGSFSRSAIGLSSLPPDAQRAILSELEKDKATWMQQAELTSSDGAANDDFGESVAISGSTIVVGAWFHQVGPNQDQGAAYVFVEKGGTWTQQAELTASDGAGSDYFGASVAVNSNTVVVGAPYHQVGSSFEQGAAYVFVREGTTWTQQAELTSSDGAAVDHFGTSVAAESGMVVVGAIGHGSSTEHPGAGAAYVFGGSGGMWNQEAELKASRGKRGDAFGVSVAISETTAVVGAYCHPFTEAEGCGPGAAYVFEESDSKWHQTAELTASDGAANDYFGVSTAVSGPTAVVGAYQHTVGQNYQQGAAYVFALNGKTWSQQAELTASDGTLYDSFGLSVAVSDSTAWVGAPNHPYSPSLGSPGPGAAYVFLQSGDTWSQDAELTASDGVAGDQFGNSVAVSGADAVLGARYHAVGSNPHQGAGYVFK
jgi:nucleoside-specific outer membrane channel protein Tsx